MATSYQGYARDTYINMLLGWTYGGFYQQRSYQNFFDTSCWDVELAVYARSYGLRLPSALNLMSGQQAASLNSSFVAALYAWELDAMSPGVVRSLGAPAIQGLSFSEVQNLSATQGGFLSNLGTNASGLGKLAVGALSATQLNVLSPEGTQSLSADALSAVTAYQAAGLGAAATGFLAELDSNAEGLSKAFVSALTGEQLERLSNHASLCLTATALSGLTANSARGLREIEPALPPPAKGEMPFDNPLGFLGSLGDNASGLNRDFLSALNGRQLDGFSVYGARALSATALGGLTASVAQELLPFPGGFLSRLGTNASGLSNGFVSALDGVRLDILSDDASQSLSTGALGALGTGNAKGLGVGSTSFLAELGSNATGLGSGFVSALDGAHLDAFSAVATKSLSTGALGALGTGNANGLGVGSTSFLAELGSNATGLGSGFVSVLDGAHLDAFSAVATKSLSTGALGALGTGNATGLGVGSTSFLAELGSNATGLGSGFVSVLDGAHLDAFSAVATKSLSTGALGALGTGNAKGLGVGSTSFLAELVGNATGLGSGFVSALDGAHLDAFSAEGTKSLSTGALGALGTGNATGLGVGSTSFLAELVGNATGLRSGFVSALDGAHLDAFSAVATKSLSTGALGALGTGNAKGLGVGSTSFLAELVGNAAGLSGQFLHALSGGQLNALSAVATRSLSKAALGQLDAANAQSLLSGNQTFLWEVGPDHASYFSSSFLSALTTQQLAQLYHTAPAPVLAG